MLELEQKIMSEIGMSNDPSYYNGSGSCGPIARNAGRSIATAISLAAVEGEKIVQPITILTELVKMAADTEPRDTTLTRTYQVAATVIRHHAEHYATGERPGQCCKSLRKYLIERFDLEQEPDDYWQELLRAWRDYDG